MGNKNRVTSGRRKPLVEELEPRLLFSADVAPIEVVVPSPEPVTESVVAEALPESAATPADVPRRELAFVDAGVEGHAALVADLAGRPGLEVVVLDADRNGIEQITEALAGRRDLDAVHVLSHGADGAVQLGSTLLTSDSLGAWTDSIASWGDAFAPTGDLLFYGCDLAAGGEGLSLVDSLAVLTGADVAASIDATGATHLGGDWDLEYTAGSIETALAFGLETPTSWQGLLDGVTYESFEVSGSEVEIRSNAQTGQTFQHTSGSGTYFVDHIDLELRKDGAAPAQNVIVELRDAWNGNVLGAAFLDSADLGTSLAWHEFNFGGVELTDGVSYTIRVSTDSVAGQVHAGFNGAGSYANGDRLDGAGSPQAGQDLLFRVSSRGGVAIDAVSTDQDETAGSLTISHTTSGTDRLMLVAVALEPDGRSVAGITYKGVALDPIGVEYPGVDARVEIWALLSEEPALGTWDVVVSLDGPNHDGVAAGVMTFTGVDQASPIGGFFSANGNSASASVDVDSAPGELVFGVVMSHLGGGVAPGLGQAEHLDVNTVEVNLGLTTEAGGAPDVATSWNITSGQWVAAGVSIRPASGAAPALVNNSLTISEGQTVVIGAGDLSATDADDPDAGLTFTVSSVTGGYFERLSAIGTPITSFLQSEVTGGQIRFVDDGNEVAPSYSVTVSDGTLSDGPTAAAITYTPVNDAPTLANAVLSAVDEDTVSPPGASISALFGAGFADPDGTFAGIAVVGNTAIPGTQGVWQYSSDGGTTWSAIGTVADDATALAIQASSWLRFVPAGDFNGAPPDLTLRGLDDTYAGSWSTTTPGEVRVTVDTTTNGGTTAIAAATSALSTSINAVNDAPVLGANALTVSEGGTVVIGAGDIAATDVDDADAGLTFTVSAVTGGYFERLSAIGTPIFSFLQSEVTGGQIRFVDDGNEVAPSYSVAVSDGSLSDGPDPAAITYTPVNDAPTLGNAVLGAVDEDTVSPPGASISALFGAGFADPDGTFAGIAVVGNTAIPGTQGVWQYSSDGGTTWSAIGTVADDATALAIQASSWLRFVPAGDFNGAPPDLTLRGLDDTYAGSWSTTTPGEVRATVDTTTNGGSTAIAAATSALSTSINAVNDAPVLGANALTIAEGGTVVIGAGDIAATDVDDADAGLTFTVSAVTGGYFERLSAIGTPITSFLQSEVTGSQIRFVDDGNEAAPSYDVSVSDGSLSDGPAAAAITYTPVNDAPTLGNGALAAVDEDTVSPPGASIASLFGAGFADPDGTFAGIAVVGNTAIPGTQGVWQYSSDGGTTWSAIGTVADDATALAIQASSWLRFVPAGDFNGAPPDLTLRGLDDTYAGSWSTTTPGEVRVTVDTTTNGGTTAIAAATSALSTSINAVNDAPVLGANALTVSEGGTVVLGAGDIAATDVDDADAGLTFTVSAVTGGYFERLSAIGTPITSFLQSEVTGSQIRFVDDGNEAAPSYDVSVSDGSLSDGPAAAAITYTPVNDAPTLGDGALAAVDEDTVSPPGASIASLFGAGFADPDGTFAGIAVVGNTAIPGTQGVWQYSSDGGTTWSAIGTVADDATALAIQASSWLRFVPAGDFNGAPPDLTLRGLDDTYAGSWSITTPGEVRATVDTTTNGGTTAIAAATSALSTSINAVNDAPVLGANALTVSEGGTVVIGAGDIAATDVDDADAGLTFTVSAVTGGYFERLSAIGTPIFSFLQSEVTGGQIRFVDDGNEVAPSYDVSVSDGSLSDGPAAAAITYTPVNDAPTLGDGALAAVDEDTVSPPGASIASLFGAGFADPDGTFAGIAVVGNTAIPGTQGVWQYSSDGGTTWSAIGTVADDATALAIQASSWLRFVPVGDFNGAPPDLTLRGLDDTYAGSWSTTTPGEVRATVDTTTNGGTSAIAAATSALSTSVNAVNDAPTIANALAGQAVGDKSTLTPFTPVSIADVDGDALVVEVRIDDPARGTLSGGGFTDLGGGVYRFSGSAGAATTAIRALVFDPTENRVAVGTAETSTFTISADDATAPLVNDSTTTVDSTSINDAPTAATTSLSVSENSPVGTVVGSAAAFDPDPGDPLSYVISAGNTGGAFAIDPSTGQVTVANPAALDFEANPVFSLTVQVADGSLASDSGAVTVNLGDVVETPILDPPPPPEPPAADEPPPPDSEPETIDEPVVEVTQPPGGDPAVEAPLAAAPPAAVLGLAERDRGEEASEPGRGIERRPGAAPEVATAPLPGIREAVLAIDDAMLRALDLMGIDMAESADASEEQMRLVSSAMQGSAAAVTAGFLSWFLRGGSLLASLVSSLPVWSRFDPLPVLDAPRGDALGDDEEDADERRAEALLGGGREPRVGA